MSSRGGSPVGDGDVLFTDIEGSTRRWEADPDGMRVALAAHDEVLRVAVEGRGGWLFKHTGDGVCAAFGSPRAAVDAAVEAQRLLGLPVRMGIGTGEAELRGDDYFGRPLNAAARVMAAGHGGQVLVAATTAALVDGVDLVDLGEHRLRDLSGVHRVFQVRAEGLLTEFPALRTLDAVPGNLPVQSTSFIGRDVEIAELVTRVRAHRLVTLTGVGGVGKTRLALQVAAELVPEFADGVWLVELAPVGDPGAVAVAVASVLGVTAQAGMSVTASVAQALSGRRLLVVLDNCEHVLDAVADVVDAVLARASTVKVLATSREGLRVGAEQLWTVPSLHVADAGSAAVELFVERARAVKPGFALGSDADAVAVVEICGRLDGIPLAIELAAARMVSMQPVEVRDRLGDRFRLLSGGRRGLERHQTLRHAVGWSYDLLDDNERTVLDRCSVFAGGFGLAAAVAVCGAGFDEYAVLDVLDSLVRKSLVMTAAPSGVTRYGLLETIRQFAQEHLDATGTSAELRDRHAHWCANEVIAWWDRWDGPGYRVAVDWVDVEFDNLRAGFGWAAERGDLDTATAIAAYTTLLAFALQRFEPVGWAEELLPTAIAADVVQLPRLYTAAAVCVYLGRPDDAVGYAQAAQALNADPRYDSFEPVWARFFEANGHRYAGRIDRWLEICAGLATQTTGAAHVFGLGGLLYVLPVVGRGDDAVAIADEAVAAARARASPLWVAFALCGYGRAYTQAEPARALAALREALGYSREHRVPLIETTIGRDLAVLEAVHGDVAEAFTLFESAIDAYQRASSAADGVAATLATLAVCLDRLDRREVAATIYGAATNSSHIASVINLAGAVDHLRTELGDTAFDRCVATGSAMDITDAAVYARAQLRLAHNELATGE